LREKDRRLQEELRRYKVNAPMLAASDRTAEAGSIPSSRVFCRRTQRSPNPRPSDGQPGHVGQARLRPIPNASPLALALEKGTECGTRLGEPFEVRRRTITDLPPPEPRIFDGGIPRYHCPGCRARVEPRPLLRSVETKLVGPGHPPTESLEFADGVRWIVRNSIERADQHPDASMDERRSYYRGVRWDMADHLRRGWRDEDAARIAGELWKRRDMLFTLLIEAGVPWHINGAETEIRQGVLYRKISGGRRSWTGAQVLERLLTVYRTCRKRELDSLSVVREAISGNGRPASGPPSAPARNLI